MTSPPTVSSTSRLAIAAAVCFAVFGLGIAAMHVLRPDDAVASHMISDYAVGQWGGVMTTAFASASLGCLLLALGFVRSRPDTLAGWAVAALFAVASIGLAVTAACPTDPPGAARTRSGDIHDVSFVVNVASVVLACVLTVVVAVRDARWRAHRLPGTLLALLLAASVVVQFKTLHRGMPYGIVNRVVVVVMIVWLVLTAMRLRQVGRAAA